MWCFLNVRMFALHGGIGFTSIWKISHPLSPTWPESLFSNLMNPSSFLPRPLCLCLLSRPLPLVPCLLPSNLHPNPPTPEASMSTRHPSSQCKRYAFWVQRNNITVKMLGLNIFHGKLSGFFGILIFFFFATDGQKTFLPFFRYLIWMHLYLQRQMAKSILSSSRANSLVAMDRGLATRQRVLLTSLTFPRKHYSQVRLELW